MFTLGEKPNSQKPELTLPSKEAALLRESLSSSHVYLEYGSGGSTLEALSSKPAKIFSVECDLNWAEKIEKYCQGIQTNKEFYILPIDIGKTKEWARPRSNEGWKNYLSAATAPWYHSSFSQPDLVLIDGRFRVTCFAVSALFSNKKIRILFDDYGDRPNYHIVEEIVRPIGFFGRMALFEFEPSKINRSAAIKTLNYYSDFE